MGKKKKSIDISSQCLPFVARDTSGKLKKKGMERKGKELKCSDGCRLHSLSLWTRDNIYTNNIKFIICTRSSLDEYCPPEDVELIQAGVLDELRHRLGNVDIKQPYLEVDEEEA